MYVMGGSDSLGNGTHAASCDLAAPGCCKQSAVRCMQWDGTDLLALCFPGLRYGTAKPGGLNSHTEASLCVWSSH